MLGHVKYILLKGGNLHGNWDLLWTDFGTFPESLAPPNPILVIE